MSHFYQFTYRGFNLPVWVDLDSIESVSLNNSASGSGSTIKMASGASPLCQRRPSFYSGYATTRQ